MLLVGVVECEGVLRLLLIYRREIRLKKNITRIGNLSWVLLVAVGWLLAWLLRDTTIVILRVLLLLLHVSSVWRWLLHVLRARLLRGLLPAY